MLLLLFPIIGYASNTQIVNSSVTTEKSVYSIADEPIRKIIISGVSWDLHSLRPITIKNLKQKSQYNLTLYKQSLTYLEELFYNYKSCDEYLTTRDTLCSHRIDCVACVKIYFKSEKVIVYFRANACYYYKGQWYKPDYKLFYSIFHVFKTDAIMPNEVIEKGIEEYIKYYNYNGLQNPDSNF